MALLSTIGQYFNKPTAPVHTHTTDHVASAAPTYAPAPSYAPPDPSFGTSAVPSLAQSPSYQAYLRQLGLSEANAQNDTDFRVNMLQNQLGPDSPQLASINQQGDLARKSILGNMESRGILRSGENEQAIAQQRTGQATQMSALQQSINDQVQLLLHNLALHKATVAQQQADQTLNAAGQTFQ